MSVTCLIVDDDPEILEYVASHIEKEGYHAVTQPSGETAEAYVMHHDIDIAIVDIMMDHMDGFELCKILKYDYNYPVIMLTARDALTDKERAFLAGTDDYVTKPFEVAELLFRIKAVLRRYQIQTHVYLRLGNLEIDQKQLEVKVNNKGMILPNKEFALLSLLVSYPRQVFERETLIEKIWGFDYEGDTRTVDVHVKRLRTRLKKLGANVHIETVRGLGYKVTADA
ncbi:DNA-binding response regulator [Staphylococcus chromogenes]|uniref:Heme response regulator HssR n=1 Tax=Staphylococcus chromogenes TaxID=46126 RepID=A0AAE5W8K5_STACR|nr:response regulator transcription factor [Staphylococcus chromogenes]MBV5191243.1 response regulator transcription factor [Staphylococcus chromogenes]MBW3132607.1 response regulator transcription factor [Staphylococcus chromogenes]MCE5005078.1 response regulator transcription factor [Staphylococcus chromogenes]MCE5092355.1 response regulator transcription factor [Staphylococcus chromogenes]MDQ7176019.1 response regulator transcription factor [Staphylococcus chromogenes]